VTLDADAPAEARGIDDHGPLQRFEHSLSTVALALLTLLPIAEIVLRRFDSGLSVFAASRSRCRRVGSRSRS